MSILTLHSIVLPLKLTRNEIKIQICFLMVFPMNTDHSEWIQKAHDHVY